MTGNYDLDLFINLSKYKPTVNVTPLENFTTELFVYILKDILKNNKPLAIEILKLFEINKVEQIINIKTQNEFKVDGRTLRPDIEIDLVDKIVFIEVKVNSQLHPSILNRNLGDQLEDYLQIDFDDKETIVYSLTKFSVVSRINKNVRWRQITSILKKNNQKNQIIDNFINFLEANQMGEIQLLQNTTDTLFKTTWTFMSFLKNIYENSKFYQNKKYKLGSEYLYESGIGYYIQKSSAKKSNSEKNTYYFLGVIPNIDNVLSFQVMQESLKTEYIDNWKKSWKKDKFGYCPIICTLDFEKITTLTTSDEQITKGTDWLNKIYDKLNIIVKNNCI